MATKKKGLESLPSRALEHGERAFGAKYLKPGFAVTPERDLELALGAHCGFGPLTVLPDLAPGKKAARGAAVNRNVAVAELRGGWDAMMSKEPHPPDPEPIDEQEAKAILAEQVPLLHLTPAHYLALEAFVGPTAVLDGVVAALDRIEPRDWANARTQGLFFVLKGVMLRARPADEQAARTRLEALLAEKDATPAAANLDILLHGREAIARRGYKYSVKYGSFQRNGSDDPASVGNLLMCDGEDAWVAAQFAALWEALKFKPAKWMAGPSPARLFFLGGEEALRTELKAVSKYPGTMQADAFESYRHLASPIAVECVKVLAGPGSKVQKDAQAWLATRG